MKHCYIADSQSPKGFVEISEEEFNAIIGDETIKPYASKVYRGKLSIEEVPTELQEDVQSVVDAKIARLGEYKNQKNTSNELQTMIEGML